MCLFAGDEKLILPELLELRPVKSPFSSFALFGRKVFGKMSNTALVSLTLDFECSRGICSSVKNDLNANKGAFLSESFVLLKKYSVR